MAWITPKTNWLPADGVTNSDMNRIEGNTKELKDTMWPLNIPMISNIDYNTLANGTIFAGTGNANAPGNYHIVTTELATTGDGSQTAVSVLTGKVYVRVRVPSTGWGAWKDQSDADTVDGKHHYDFLAHKRNSLTSEDLNNPNYPEAYVASTSLGNSMGLTETGWWHIMYFRHQDNNGFGAQIAIPLDNTNANAKYRSSSGTTWGGWKNFKDGGNADTVDGYHVSKGVNAGEFGLRVTQMSTTDIGVGAGLSAGELFIVYE